MSTGKNEKKYFCDTLGIDEEDYKYMRQMVRLQHFMTSNPEYSYSSLLEMSESSDDKTQEDFQNWKSTKMFVDNNTYEAIENAVMEKLGTKDRNKDGEVNYEDLKEDDRYEDTYDFLEKLKKYEDTK